MDPTQRFIYCITLNPDKQIFEDQSRRLLYDLWCFDKQNYEFFKVIDGENMDRGLGWSLDNAWNDEGRFDMIYNGDELIVSGQNIGVDGEWLYALKLRMT